MKHETEEVNFYEVGVFNNFDSIGEESYSDDESF
jgi:hypothetical protein